MPIQVRQPPTMTELPQVKLPPVPKPKEKRRRNSDSESISLSSSESSDSIDHLLLANQDASVKAQYARKLTV